MKVERFVECEAQEPDGRAFLLEDGPLAVLLTVYEDGTGDHCWRCESILTRDDGTVRRRLDLNGVQPSEMLAVRYGKGQATLVLADLIREAQASSEKKVRARRGRTAR